MTTTVTSREVRTSRIERPGPPGQPGHQAVARAGAELAADVHRAGDAVDDDPAEQHDDAPPRAPSGAATTGSMRSVAMPMTKTLAMVPSPGHWRSGIQSSSTRMPTTRPSARSSTRLCWIRP